MNIKELKKHIEDLPDDILVVTRGYENGYDDAHCGGIIEVYKRKNKEWWEGRYDDKDEYFEYEGDPIKVLSL